MYKLTGVTVIWFERFFSRGYWFNVFDFNCELWDTVVEFEEGSVFIRATGAGDEYRCGPLLVTTTGFGFIS